MTRVRTSFLRKGATALLALGACALWACDALLTRPSLYATVTATVARRDGTPIPNASLTLYTGQRPMGYAVTDTLGRYTFVDVPEGLYGLRADPPSGYVRLETLLSTTAPSEVVQNIWVMAQNRDSARRLAALEPKLVLFGHGPPLRDRAALSAFAATLSD